MSSIIEGYNYDIFISYRQKDNKGDRWVSEFVDSLKTELESTFKEEISVYFDINPHDGLLETHDVDASLKDKLKCLVFIPIISRTYCDPKSFAWEHEFKAFVEEASQDRFGLKVKFANGNVASRVLPVRIHDLDNADIKECESVLGGVLRGIEFIYKELGIDKPLTADDDEKKNLNKTKYRIQIIKVTHAIKEIIQGMKAEPGQMAKEKTLHKEPLEEVKKKERKEEKEKSTKMPERRLLSGITILVILMFVAVFAYPKIFKRNTLEKLRSTGERIAVVVMPFQNMTSDTTWSIWQDGIQNELISSLTNSEELKVRQTESINNLLQSKGFTNYTSITPAVASKLSQKLDANIFIYGSIKQVGTTIRINAQIIDSKTQDAFKSFQIDGIAENILHMIDSLSNQIKNFLIISKLEKELSEGLRHYGSTSSSEAFRYFIYGNKSFYNRDYPTAIDWYLKSFKVDSSFTIAAAYLSISYYNQGLYEQGRKWCLDVYKKRDLLPLRTKIMTNWLYAFYFETTYEQIKYLKQFFETDDLSPLQHYLLGANYNALYQFDNAIPEFEKSLDISNKLDSRPLWVRSYTELGYAYHKTGQFKKEKMLYKKAEKDFPDDPLLIRRQAILSLTEGDTVSANDYIKRYISISKERIVSDAIIVNNLAMTYEDAGILNKAEEYYRKALSLDPGNPTRMNNLAWFLIDRDRNINEGMELIDKALAISPDKYTILDTKGWGLYKQSKYEEALKLIEKADSLEPVYDHELYLHLEAAKKAVASQKNN
jgi:tetratricopeptide (TPR) repeat protein